MLHVRPQEDSVHVRACRVDVSTIVDCCPVHELRAAGAPPQPACNLTAAMTRHTVRLLGRDECAHAHSGRGGPGSAATKTVVPLHYAEPGHAGRGTFVAVRPNSTSEPVPLPTACHDSYFDGQDWHANVLTKVVVTVTLSDFWVPVRLSPTSRDTLVMTPDKECDIRDGYCAGLPQGEAVWDVVPDEACPAADDHPGPYPHYYLAHNGAASLVSLAGDEAKYVSFLDGNQRGLAYRLGGSIKVCGGDGYLSDRGGNDSFAGVVIIIDSVNATAAQPPVPSSFTLNMADAEALAVHGLWVDLNRNATQQRADLAACLERRKQLRDQMALARSAADPVAALEGVLPATEGLHGVVVGGALYLKQCVAVDVQMRSSPRCYQEVPVVAAGVEAFMTYPARILVPAGREVPCDPLAPPLFHLGGEWLAFHPNSVWQMPRGAALPSTLDPRVPPQQGEQPIAFRPPAGRWPASADFFAYSAYRGAFLNAMTMRALLGDGDDSHVLRATAMFSRADWAEVYAKAVAGVDAAFRRFAGAVCALLCVAVLALVAKAVLQAALGRRLLRAVGERASPGLMLLGGLSPGLLVARLVERRGPQRRLHGERGPEADDLLELGSAKKQDQASYAQQAQQGQEDQQQAAMRSR